MKVVLVYILIAVSICFIGCETPPVEEMGLAREAVARAAIDENAARYASGTLARAREALKDMEDAAAAKRYDDAKRYAGEAITAANKAIIDGRDAASRAADTTVVYSDFQASIIKEEIDEASRNVAGAQYSRLALDYNALERSLINAYNTLDQAQVDSAAGRHQDAENKAKQIRADLYDINQMVANAAASGRKK